MLHSNAQIQTIATTRAKCDCSKDTQTVANQELESYLEFQANVLAPDISPIVPKVIKVEKVGLTRNSSSTPYLVYRVGERRCCTFFKRKLLWQLMQALLRIEYGIDEKIRSIVSTQFFDLSLKLGDSWLNVALKHVCQFVERCNNRTQEAVIVPSDSLKDYYMGTSAQNCQVEMPQCNQQQPEADERVSTLLAAMKSAVASQNWEILCEALYGNEQYKAQAWKQLSREQQQKLTMLTPQQVKMLVQARREGKIAVFVEHSSSGIFSVWRTLNDEPEMLSNTAVAGFLNQLE